jgi:hypothetical protein
LRETNEVVLLIQVFLLDPLAVGQLPLKLASEVLLTLGFCPVLHSHQNVRLERQAHLYCERALHVRVCVGVSV